MERRESYIFLRWYRWLKELNMKPVEEKAQYEISSTSLSLLTLHVTYAAACALSNE